MSVPKFRSISLDTPSDAWHTTGLSPDEILPRHYIGLLKSMPSAEHPEGVELSGAGYQRQFFEPKSPAQKLEWSATEDWNSVTGFIVYDQFRGGVPLLWKMFYRELHIFKGETAVVHYRDLVSSLLAVYATDGLDFTGAEGIQRSALVGDITYVKTTKEPTFK